MGISCHFSLFFSQTGDFVEPVWKSTEYSMKIQSIATIFLVASAISACSLVSDVQRYGCLHNYDCQSVYDSNVTFSCLPLSETSDQKVCDLDEDYNGVSDTADEVGAAGVTCLPNCESKECGDDRCGGDCGDGYGEKGCEWGEVCVNGTCTNGGIICNGKTCLPEETSCNDGACCKPDCSGRECGPDGCGGDCYKLKSWVTYCGSTWNICVDGQCVEK
jgi:hypothetical protein